MAKGSRLMLAARTGLALRLAMRRSGSTTRPASIAAQCWIVDAGGFGVVSSNGAIRNGDGVVRSQ
eukprot:6397960-Lingulodinium_polyedra.AAC.1